MKQLNCIRNRVKKALEKHHEGIKEKRKGKNLNIRRIKAF